MGGESRLRQRSATEPMEPSSPGIEAGAVFDDEDRGARAIRVNP
jgi:hypothetical protein